MKIKSSNGSIQALVSLQFQGPKTKRKLLIKFPLSFVDE